MFVPTGVSKGSHVRPLLVSQICNGYLIESSSLRYADDIKVFGEVSTVRDSIQLQCVFLLPMGIVPNWGTIDNSPVSDRKYALRRLRTMQE